MDILPVAVFTYKIDNLYDEITKRTSVLGKMRGTEQDMHLLDRLSLTKGEGFMLSEFLDNAISETYEWVKAFGRNVDVYDKYALEYEDTFIYKNYGVYAEDKNGNEIEFDKQIKLNVTHYAALPKTNIIDVGFEGFKLNQKKGDNTKVKATYIYKVYSILGDILDVEESYEYIKEYTNYSNIPSAVVLPFEYLDPTGQLHGVKQVELYVTFEAITTAPYSIKKDSYVEYRTDFSDDSVFEVYKVSKDCTSADWKKYAKKAPVDPRGNVVYILERKEHFDENMISSVDRNLKEAMVNHIIYQWFEYVNAPEAERFLLKFEDYGHKAQIGMNTRTKDVQRRYKLF